MKLWEIIVGVVSAIVIVSISTYYVIEDQKIEKCNEMADQLNSKSVAINNEVQQYEREWFPTPMHSQQLENMKDDYENQLAIYEYECT